MSLRLLVIVALALLPALGPWATHTATSAAPSNWKVYPAFNREPLRIIDTPAAAYFLVLQSYYQKNTTIYTRARTTIFRYDYSRPEAGIEPMGDTLLHGDAYPVLAEYDRAEGSLFLVYSDGRTQIIFADGRTAEGDRIPDVPGNNELTALTIGGGEAVVTTGFGLVCFDAATGRLTRRLMAGKRLDCAARAGERIVAISEGRLFEADAPRGTATVSSLKEVITTDGIRFGDALRVVPLNDSSVAVPAGTFTQGIHILTLADNNWNHSDVGTVNMLRRDQLLCVTSPLESNMVANRDGYVLHGPDWAIQLYASATASSPAHQAIKMVTYAPGDYPAVGSWDFSRFWRYRQTGVFNMGTLEGGTVAWNGDEGTMRPNAPAMLMTSGMIWSPKFGHVAMSQGLIPKFNDGVAGCAASLGALSGGKWTMLSPNYNPPRSIQTNQYLADLYNNNPYTYPTGLPCGVVFDPVNPDFAFTGSWNNGVIVFNASDPADDVMMFAQPSNRFRDLPRFKALFPDNKKYLDLCCISNVGFDQAGNLWTMYYNYDEDIAGRSSTQLWCWPRDNRTATLVSGDVSKATGWFNITLPLPGVNTSRHSLLVAQHPDNKGLLVLGLKYDKMAIYDIKNTPADESDDTMRCFSHILIDGIGKVRAGEFFAMREDPETGDVWLAGFDRLVCFNPRDKVTDGCIPGRSLNVSGGDHPSDPTAGHYVHDICFDSLNRMWIATATNGVWGISADRKSVVAHYTSANSPLPSDNTYSISWNPMEQSLLVSTDGGFAEVRPEGVSGHVGERLHAWPRSVDASFGGSIAISGTNPGETVVVCDIRGNEVARTMADASGRAAWNLRRTDGSKALGGTYLLHSPSGRFADTEITVIP